MKYSDRLRLRTLLGKRKRQFIINVAKLAYSTGDIFPLFYQKINENCQKEVTKRFYNQQTYY